MIKRFYSDRYPLAKLIISFISHLSLRLLFISSDSRRNEPKKTATPSPYIGDVAAPLVALSLR